MNIFRKFRGENCEQTVKSPPFWDLNQKIVAASGTFEFLFGGLPLSCHKPELFISIIWENGNDQKLEIAWNKIQSFTTWIHMVI